jgi:hypothetical protein
MNNLMTFSIVDTIHPMGTSNIVGRKIRNSSQSPCKFYEPLMYNNTNDFGFH